MKYQKPRSGSRIPSAVVYRLCLFTRGSQTGPRRIFTKLPVDERYFVHSIRFGREYRRGWLQVDQMANVTGRAPGPRKNLNITSKVVVLSLASWQPCPCMNYPEFLLVPVPRWPQEPQLHLSSARPTNPPGIRRLHLRLHHEIARSRSPHSAQRESRHQTCPRPKRQPVLLGHLWGLPLSPRRHVHRLRIFLHVRS